MIIRMDSNAGAHMMSMVICDSIAVAHIGAICMRAGVSLRWLGNNGHLDKTHRPSLELLWAAIAQCLMQAPAVMEALDILRDGIAGLGLILKLPMPDRLILLFLAWRVYGCAVE